MNANSKIWLLNAAATIVSIVVFSLVTKYITLPIVGQVANAFHIRAIFGLLMAFPITVVILLPISIGTKYAKMILRGGRLYEYEISMLVQSFLVFMGMIIASSLAYFTYLFVLSGLNKEARTVICVGLYFGLQYIVSRALDSLVDIGIDIGIADVRRWRVIPLKKELVKIKRENRKTKDIYQKGLPAASLVVEKSEVALVKISLPDVDYDRDRKIIDVAFIASGDPRPKPEDYEWFTLSDNEFVNSEAWISDDVIKVRVSLSSLFYSHLGWIEADAQVTLTGMHRDYRGPGLSTTIKVFCWS